MTEGEDRCTQCQSGASQVMADEPYLISVCPHCNTLHAAQLNAVPPRRGAAGQSVWGDFEIRVQTVAAKEGGEGISEAVHAMKVRSLQLVREDSAAVHAILSTDCLSLCREPVAWDAPTLASVPARDCPSPPDRLCTMALLC